MRKIQFTAAFWTLLIAIPFTALAIMASAYISDHLIQISTGLAAISQKLVDLGFDMIMEAELTGMVAGMLLILAITLATYLLGRREKEQNSTVHHK